MEARLFAQALKIEFCIQLHFHYSNLPAQNREVPQKNLKLNTEGLRSKLTDGEAYALIKNLQRHAH